MSIDMVLSKSALFEPIITLTTTPSGTYKGSKTVLGQTINTEVDVTSDTLMNLIITGVISLSCSDEEYALNGNEVTVTHITEDGDCAHDALAENNVSLKSVSYDDSADTITVSVKYSVMSIDMILSKSALTTNLRGSAIQ